MSISRLEATLVNLIEGCYGSDSRCRDYEVEDINFYSMSGEIERVKVVVKCPHSDVCKYYKENKDDKAM